MSTPSYRELFDRLESSGHLSVETRKEAEKAVTASSDGDDSSSRLISVVAGIGAWLTTLFLVFGLIAFGLVDVGDLSSLVIAFVLGAVAVGIDQLDVDRNAFTSQMMLAMSFAAQAVALVGIASLDGPDRLLGATAFCGAMYVLVPSTANRLVSAALLASNFGWETIENEAGYLLLFGWALALPCVVFGARNALPSRLRLAARPAAYVGATVSLVLTITELSTAIADWMPLAQRIMLAVASVCLLVWAHTSQSERSQTRIDGQTPREADDRRFVWAAGAVILLGLVTAPGILCAALIVGLGLWRHRTWLTGLGAVGLTAHMVTYYYQLDITLLEKSGVLVASGLVLLGLRWVLERHSEASLDQKERG
jgi:hypothetical protein